MAANIYVDAWFRDHMSKEAASASSKVVAGFTKIAGALGIGVGVYQLIGAFKSWSKEALEAERVDTLLTSTMEMLGGEVTKTKEYIDSLTTGLMKTTKFGDEETKGVIQELALNFNDVNRAIASLPMVLDIAQAAQLDLGSATRLTILGLNGNIEALGRILPMFRNWDDVIGKTATTQDKANYFTKIYSERMEGARYKLEGANAAVTRFKLSMGELREELGRSVNQGVGPFTEAMTPMIEKLREWVEERNRILKDVNIEPITLFFDPFTRAKVLTKKSTWQALAKNVKDAVSGAKEAIVVELPETRVSLGQILLDEKAARDAAAEAWKKAHQWWIDLKGKLFMEALFMDLNVGVRLRVKPPEVDPIEEYLHNWMGKETITIGVPVDIAFQLDTAQAGLNQYQEDVGEMLDVSAINWDEYFAGISSAAAVGWQFVKAGVGGLQSGIRSLLASGLQDWKSFFKSILDAFLDMISQMAAQAAMYGFLNLITGGWMGLATGGGGFAKFMGFKAQGYETITSGPQMFVAGERGPEHVKVTPLGYNAPARATAGNVYHITYQINALDADSVIDKFVFGDWGRKLARLQARGY